MCALPLVFQTTQEWDESDLGLHQVQVASQIAIPELDGATKPIILSGRDGNTGRAIKWANLQKKPKLEKKVAITVFSFPPDQGGKLLLIWMSLGLFMR